VTAVAPSRDAGTGRPPVPRRSLRLLVISVLALQVVWILSVPPFRASDEFDHVYRAASVARGDWRAESSSATRGTGAMVTVPSDIVDAARPECRRLRYTEDVDCVGAVEGSETRVATGAGRYNPVFYALIGVPALPFDGAAALYVMRLVSALLCLALLAAALAAVREWARTPWPYLGVVLACSPVVVFSTSVAAPNGIEMMAGIGLWAALMGLFRTPAPPRQGVLLAIGAASASVLITARSLGPLWAVLILAAVALSAPDRRRTLGRLMRDRAVLLAAAGVLVVTLLSLAWIFSTGSLVIGKVPDAPDMSTGEKVQSLVKTLVAWIFQSIGAFPYRNVPAPMAVYACYLVVVVWFVARGLRAADRAERAAICTVAVLALLIPLGITIATFDDYGIAWQGRYTIPFSLGFIFLSGAALDRAARQLSRPLMVISGLLFVAAQALSPAMTAAKERLDSPGVANGDWLLVSPWVLGLVATVAAATLWLGAASDTTEVSGERP
jgi:hypothetical protein